MTHNDSQVEAHDEILHALIALGHQITADEVRFFRDTSKDTTALAQLCDSLEAAWNRRTALSALAAGKVEANNRVPVSTQPYRTSPGESLCGIAIRELGDENRWTEIRDLNADRFPDMLGSSYYPVNTLIALPLSAASPSPLSADPESAVVGAANNTKENDRG